MLNNYNYNPDVLSCLANLSSDEVFTPPQLVNQILDLLPEDIWSDKNARFLDPVCKTGVFLREIAKRLDAGLEKKISDRQKRINHIFNKQLFGISITELTSLLSRRSVYCSKTANGKYSVCETFDNPQGNIRFERFEHIWKNGRCAFCGANEANYERGEELETHAYEFIHTEKPEEIFKMKFDVIIGNPPYHMSDAGAGVSAIPLYHKFVQQAKKLNPRFLTMIIPARWFAGGKGLDDFRNEMLNDIRLKTIVDFASSKDCFPGVDIAGGVCYFLWDRDYSGNCTVINRFGEDEYSAERVLNEFSIFIRNNLAIKIIKKVIDSDDPNLSNTVFSRNPFGFATKDRGKKNPFKDSIKLISSAGIGYVRRNDVQKNKDKIDKYKIIIGKVVPCNGEVGVNPKDGYKVTTRNRVLMPGEIHTDSYIMLSAFDTELEAKNFSQYMDLKFPRFLLHHTITSLNITKEYFIFVPRLYYSKKWTDERLYKRYGLTKDEIDFVESTIRPIESNNE